MEDKAFKVFDLRSARKITSVKIPQPHQNQALNKLNEWSKNYAGKEAGGILVLPTGAGKTFTAVRFLCSNLISDGYKVVWLAHTHHLLEQADESFSDSVGKIAEPKENLRVRIVSGTKSHDDVHEIKADDDVLVITLQTMANAYEREHPALLNFLKSAHGKLCVVFDEAHHSPAPTYAKLLIALREQNAQMLLLGLTATPTHNDAQKKGWLKRLFPQGIIYSVKRGDLMKQGILSRPRFETIPTNKTPDFDEREFEKWVGTYRDLPEDVIESLARNKERNIDIASTYVNNREKYGKTIIFADRWYQCDMLREFLKIRDVNADVVYSHVDSRGGSVDERNLNRTDENKKVLDRFRNGELDVIINVKMLTEGTDVPNVQSVFMTRQTTSNILLTQMIGRALRGEKFGGTKEAFIVTFTDNWNQPINWADYSELEDGPAGEGGEYGKRPPLNLISIDLVRQLSRQLDSGINVASKEFLSCMPSGWYRVEFQASVDNSDDIESVRQLVMVFDDEVESYQRLIKRLTSENLEEFASERVRLDDVIGTIESWSSEFFGENETVAPADRKKSLLQIARHMAQNDNEPPQFFNFDARDLHDLDAVATQIVENDLGPSAQENVLNKEYNRKDCYWSTIYPSYYLFKSQCDACVNRIMATRRSGTSTFDATQFISHPEEVTDAEPSDIVKLQVKNRDGYCLCCLEIRRLEVDHIIPRYYGGTNEEGNLQTLCKQCNSDKSFNTINFMIRRNPTLMIAPSKFPSFALPKGERAKIINEWEKALRRHFNFYYQADAVSRTKISARGANFYEWEIELYEGNNPSWVSSFLPKLLESIQASREAAKVSGPEALKITSPGLRDVVYSAKISEEEEKNPGVDGIPNGTLCDFIFHDKKYSGKISGGEFIVRGIGSYDSLSAASRAITRKTRNGWTDWHIKLPGNENYVRADKWKKENAIK